jgi:Leucine-rich repeat (LRR) protein
MGRTLFDNFLGDYSMHDIFLCFASISDRRTIMKNDNSNISLFLHNFTILILLGLSFSSLCIADTYDDTAIVLNLLQQNNIPLSNFKGIVKIRNNRVISLDLSAYTLSNFRENDTGGSVGGFLGGGQWDGFKRLYRIQKLPDDITKLDSLQVLNLSFNGIDSFPSILFKLKELRALDFSGNGIKHLPVNMTEFENLSELYLGFDSLQTFPIDLFKLKSLKKLDVSHNQIIELPDIDCEQIHLDYLNVSGNKIKHFPPAYCQCKNIKKKDYSRNSDWITTRGCNRFSKAYEGWIFILFLAIPISIILVASHFSK